MKTNCSEGLAIAMLSALVTAPLLAQAPYGWTQVATTGPAVRAYHAMAYDSQRGRTVMFGGGTGTFLGDTWEWNGAAWTQVATTGPLGCNDPAMAYDSQRGRTVLFGGFPSYGGTWEWNGSSWTQVGINGPTRWSHAMAYDSQRGRTVLFGGSSGFFSYGDTWEWNGTTWTQVATTGPAARYGHAMAYDSQRGRTVLFGGYDGSYYGDTWEWNGSTWTQVAATGPSARQSHAMAYDSLHGATVLFGGTGWNGVANTYPSDTWEWNGTAWVQVVTAMAPRLLYAMAYDSQRGQTVVFGGCDANLAFLGDTWEFNGGLASTAANFGVGCGSPALSLSPVATARPTINATAQVSLSNIPSALAYITLGFSRTTFGSITLPLSLAPFGLPGCDLLVSRELPALPVTFTGASTATFTIPVPNNSSLIGLHVYLQGWAFAPGVNPGQVVVSNGVDWGIGNL